MKEVVIYTDGGCRPNPGPGGYGVVLMFGAHRRELSGGYRRTTNNRMELLAAIHGLETLKETCHVHLFSDSQYVVNGIMQGWARKWRSNGWQRSNRESAENPDLWERLLILCERHKVHFEWVRGHAGHEENERCDALATASVTGTDFEIDVMYESIS